MHSSDKLCSFEKRKEKETDATELFELIQNTCREECHLGNSRLGAKSATLPPNIRDARPDGLLVEKGAPRPASLRRLFSLIGLDEQVVSADDLLGALLIFVGAATPGVWMGVSSVDGQEGPRPSAPLLLTELELSDTEDCSEEAKACFHNNLLWNIDGSRYGWVLPTPTPAARV